MRTKHWYVAHLVNMFSFNLLFCFYFHQKMKHPERGQEGGPEGGPERGPEAGAEEGGIPLWAFGLIFLAVLS